MLNFIKSLFKKPVVEKPKAPEIGVIYRFRNINGNPFSSVFYAKVLAVSGDYLQYIFVNEGGEHGWNPIKWSDTIKTFNSMYSKKEF